MKPWVARLTAAMLLFAAEGGAAVVAAEAGSNSSEIDLVIKDLVGALASEIAFPKRWPDGPLRVNVVTVDLLNDKSTSEALRQAFEATVAERLDYLGKEIQLETQERWDFKNE